MFCVPLACSDFYSQMIQDHDIKHTHTQHNLLVAESQWPNGLDRGLCSLGGFNYFVVLLLYTENALYFVDFIYFAVFPMNVILLEFNFADSELLQCSAKTFACYLISRKQFIHEICEINPMRNLRLLQYLFSLNYAIDGKSLLFPSRVAIFYNGTTLPRDSNVYK